MCLTLSSHIRGGNMRVGTVPVTAPPPPPRPQWFLLEARPTNSTFVSRATSRIQTPQLPIPMNGWLRCSLTPH